MSQSIFDIFEVRNLTENLVPDALLNLKIHGRTKAMLIRYHRVMKRAPLSAADIAKELGIDRQLCYQQLRLMEMQGYVSRCDVAWGKTKWEFSWKEM